MVRVLGSALFVYSCVVAASQDPTAPLGWQKPDTVEAENKNKQPPLPKLQSIVCTNTGQCRAVLNDKAVLVGETINGFRISQIEAQSVTISHGGKQWKLKIFTQDVKN
ncbi:MSHA biogenesis protein MshK [Vibrio sp. OCN044]|uniref:MSHA biogenesis protein MshK n=1 Tax=Vibrio tetraodonis subsp. pristinus TaxID=2695891 RepID=A0A6L8M5D0_9VIBR|nr:MSHA biogenesis protein MshK [Vibrio tetraodonis]MYM61152.1 MSHA biogenesis protein MshK [Vibrio tetraodonis subsp. pristinus]